MQVRLFAQRWQGRGLLKPGADENFTYMGLIMNGLHWNTWANGSLPSAFGLPPASQLGLTSSPSSPTALWVLTRSVDTVTSASALGGPMK